jgi:hypothetical protein
VQDSVTSITIPRTAMTKSLEGERERIRGSGARRPVAWDFILKRRQQIFLASKVSIPALGPNQIYIQWVKGELFPRG